MKGDKTKATNLREVHVQFQYKKWKTYTHTTCTNKTMEIPRDLLAVSLATQYKGYNDEVFRHQKG